MRKISAILAMVIFLCLSAITVHGQEIRIVLFKSQPLTDLIPILLKESGLKGESDFYPWSRAYQIALHEKNVLIGPFLKTRERESLFKWMDTPAYTSRGFLYKLRKRTDIRIANLADAEKYRIGLSKNYALPKSLTDQGFRKNLEPAVSEEINLRKLFAERIDLIVMYEQGLGKKMEAAGLDIRQVEPAYLLYENETYFAFSSDTPDEIVMQVADALVRLEKDGTLDRLREKDR